MYDIEYYFDKNGYSAISDYFADLANTGGKSINIAFKTINLSYSYTEKQKYLYA